MNDKYQDKNKDKVQAEKKPEKKPVQLTKPEKMEKSNVEAMVSRAEYDRLRVELTAERLLAAAGAKNLTAAKALLDLTKLDVNTADWQASLASLVQELRHSPDSAFLFARNCQDSDCVWLGLQPAAASDMADIYGEDGGYAFRLAQADGVEAIKLKQEAAAKGIIL